MAQRVMGANVSDLSRGRRYCGIDSVSRKYTKKGRRNTRLIWSLLFHDDRSKPGRNSPNASLIPADPVSGNQRRRALSEENGQSFPLVGCLPATRRCFFCQKKASRTVIILKFSNFAIGKYLLGYRHHVRSREEPVTASS